MPTISPFLWFESQAEEAAAFYTSLFSNSKVGAIARYQEGSPGPVGSVMTVSFTLAGQEFTALNGGPLYKFSPAISFFVHCETKEEIDAHWAKLSEGGFVMMPLQKWPFSEYFGWLSDRYGVSWQFFLGKHSQKIVPCLMFVGSQYGRCEEAINLYTNIFPNSKIHMIDRYDPEQGEKKDAIRHSKFSLSGYEFIAMESGMAAHKFNFDQAISFVASCATQSEVDTLWKKLTENGGKEVQCGWLSDPFGVPWQIVPDGLGDLLGHPDPAKAQRAMQAMLKMKKLDIEALKKAIAE